MEPYKLTIDRKIDRWDEGIPMGNGEMGCLLFGDAKKLVLSLDRGDIWDRSGSPEKTEGFTYANLVKWAHEGDTKSIWKTFDVPYNKPTPTKLPTGRLELEIGSGSRSCFELNMDTAESTYTCDNIWFKTYTHATEKVGMAKTNAEDLKLTIVNPKFGKKTAFDSIFGKLNFKGAVAGKLKNVKYPPAQFGEEKKQSVSVRYFVQTLNDNDCYGVAVAYEKKGEFYEMAYYAYYCRSAQELKKVLLDTVVDALEKGYDNLFESHKKWWEDYNNKSSINVPDDYIQNRYNMGNYLLGSASRKGCYPMPLQGLWTACDDKLLPPWKGDYHHDLNTQMTYYSYLKANHLEQGESFIDYLYSLKDRAADFAKRFYGAKGICLPSVMDIDGYAMGGWAMYSLSPTNQMWLCQSFERYYTYTGDREFLEKIAYPYMEQSARFILSLLKEDEEGYYVLPISSSPEIHDNTLKAFLKPNSNYDEAMLLYIFISLKRLAGILEKEADKTLWTDTLSKLRPLAVNDKNILRISRDEDLNESHRHQSHAMSIHPLRLLDYSNDRERQIIDATIARAVELGSKWYTGYSIAWIGEFFTVAKNGDEALKYLEIFWKYFCSVNTFHLNGDYTKQGYSSFSYRPFTLEGNFCAQDVLQEMMLYSENGYYELFPALPKKWNNVSFKTLRGWGGVLVSAKIENSSLKEAKFQAENDVEFILRTPVDGLEITGGKTEKTEHGLKVILKKGETLSLSK